MIDTKHLLKVVAAWISITYTICYVGVAIYPPIRALFMKYTLHTNIAMTSDYFGIGYFFSGLVIWNIAAVVLAWLFAYLFNKMKE